MKKLVNALVFALSVFSLFLILPGEAKACCTDADCGTHRCSGANCPTSPGYCDDYIGNPSPPPGTYSPPPQQQGECWNGNVNCPAGYWPDPRQVENTFC